MNSLFDSVYFDPFLRPYISQFNTRIPMPIIAREHKRVARLAAEESVRKEQRRRALEKRAVVESSVEYKAKREKAIAKHKKEMKRQLKRL